MKKLMLKTIIVSIIMICVYFLVVNFSGVQSIFGDYPWLRPLLIIVAVSAILYNFRRDILSNRR